MHLPADTLRAVWETLAEVGNGDAPFNLAAEAAEAEAQHASAVMYRSGKGRELDRAQLSAGLR